MTNPILMPTETATDTVSPVGDLINHRYRVIRLLGQGGSAQVLLVEDLVKKRTVALKKVSLASGAGKNHEYLKFEFLSLTRLSHPNLPEVYDFEFDPEHGEYFFTMEHVSGRDFLESCRRLSWKRQLSLWQEIGEGLHYIHSRGLLHCDLKPANIVVTGSRKPPRLKLLDFSLSEPDAGDLTRRLKGTIPYLAPEVFRTRMFSKASDLYALGVIFYQSLTGRLPFDGKDCAAIIREKMEQEPLPPSRYAPGLSPEIDGLVLRCLSGTPAGRYPSALHLVRDLARLAEDGASSASCWHTQASVVHPSPFVGRKREITRLGGWVAALRGGDSPREWPAFVAVAGETGGGKTRLLKEVRCLAQVDRVLVLEAAARSQVGFFRLVREMFSQALPYLPAEDRAQLPDLIRELVREEEGGVVRSLAPETGPQFFESLLQFCLSLARRQPLLLLIDDLHLADPFSLEVLGYIRKTLLGQLKYQGERPPLMLVYTYTPERMPAELAGSLAELGTAPLGVTLSLASLDREEIDRWISLVLVGDESFPELVDFLAAHTHGNPFFLYQTVLALIDRKVLTPSGLGRWQCATALLARQVLPASLPKIVEKRLAGREAREMRLLRLLTLWEGELPVVLASRITGFPPAIVRTLASKLDQDNLLEYDPERKRLGLPQAEIRQAVFSTFPAQVRAEWHRRILRTVEGLREGERYAEEMVHHAEEGKLPDKALGYTLLVARQSMQLMSPAHARQYLRRAEGLSRQTRRGSRRTIFQLYLLLGQVERSLGHLGESRECLKEARAHLGRGQDLDQLALEEGQVALLMSEWERAEESFREALEAAASPRWRVLARVGLAEVRLQRGQPGEALAMLQPALAEVPARHSRELVEPRLKTFALLGKICAIREEREDAARYFRQAIRLAAIHRVSSQMAGNLNNLAVLYASRTTAWHLHVSYRFCRVAERLARAQGNLVLQGIVANNLGGISQHLNSPEEAVHYFNVSLELSERIGRPLAVAIALYNLAEIRSNHGEYQEARRLLKESLKLSRRLGDRVGKIHVYGEMGRIYGRLGAWTQARRLLAVAVREAVAAGEALQEANSRAGLAAALAESGAYAEGRRELDLALAYYRATGHPVEEVHTLSRWAPLAWKRGEQAAALVLAREAFRLGTVQRIDEVLSRVYALWAEVDLALSPQHWKGPALLCEKALELTANREARWRLQLTWGRALQAGNDLPAASRHYTLALEQLKTVYLGLPGALRRYYAENRIPSSLLEEASALRRRFLTAEQEKGGIPMSTAEKLGSRQWNVEKLVLGFQGELEHLNANTLRREHHRQHQLIEIYQKINSELELKSLLACIVDSVVEFTAAERGFLLLVDPDGSLSFEAARNFEREEVANPESSISHSIAREVISGGRTIIATNAQEDSRFVNFTSVNDLKLRSVISLPLKCRDTTIGALYLDNRIQQEVFTEGDKELLEAFCNQAALAISNARLLADKEEREQQLQESLTRIEQLNRELESANRKLEYQVEATTSELKEVKEMLLETQHELEVKYHYGNIVGIAPRMQEVFSLVDRIKDTNVPVLIQGESGTGKELIAKAIHFNSPRRKKRFAAENCAAISDTLLESELFGYVKGAFTGADKDKKGIFEIADGGTMFLDEVGDMSQEMQKKLLRVLQEGEFRRVGGKGVIRVDVRIISASNKDLRALVEEGSFRRDLFYRLNVLAVELPPLRERVEDIPFLAEHFLAEFGRTENTLPKRLRKDGMKVLQDYPWPGNVRELRNVLLGVASLTDRNVLTARDISAKLPVERPPVPGDGGMEEITIDEYLRRFVTRFQAKYSDTRIAQILGINRKTLWEKRRRWNLHR